MVSQLESNSKETTLEIDSHADTTCLGHGALKIFDFNSPVNVQGDDPALGVRQYSTIPGVVGYVHPFTGRKIRIVVHQAIHMPELGHHLLCPMQVRANGVTLNECPRMYCSEPSAEDHAVVALDEDGERVIMPLFLKGVTSVLETCPVTLEEFDHHVCPKIELTAANLTWDPSSTVYEDQENYYLDYKGDLTRPGAHKRAPLMLINSVTTSTSANAIDVMDGNDFVEALEVNVNVSYLRLSKPRRAAEVARGPAFGNIHSEKGK